MKLRNKKTGEVITSKELLTDEFIIDIFSRNFDYFNSKLRKLQDEWEEYEEPKDYWFITWCGDIDKETDEGFDVDNQCKEIGNYFETKEEAEKAVEKLKAWKRLKDNGFKFQFWTSSYSGDKISFFIDWINADSKKEIEKDLDLLFGGEE